MREMRLKPAPDRWVPQHDGRPWPVEGMTVVVDHYVRRRLRDGDLVEAPEEPEAAAPVAAAETETPAAPSPVAPETLEASNETGRKGRRGEK